MTWLASRKALEKKRQILHYDDLIKEAAPLPSRLQILRHIRGKTSPHRRSPENNSSMFS
jgi:hypothetical protein